MRLLGWLALTLMISMLCGACRTSEYVVRSQDLAEATRGDPAQQRRAALPAVRETAARLHRSAG